MATSAAVVWATAFGAVVLIVAVSACVRAWAQVQIARIEAQRAGDRR
ncbi:hypothetical protein [Streptomyces sp. RFCAC02]|nr:hypothetical protein [Streptomyces sp. RFCAC02]